MRARGKTGYIYASRGGEGSTLFVREGGCAVGYSYSITSKGGKVRKSILALSAASVMALSASSVSAVQVDDPVGVFTDSQGNAGYVQVDEGGPAVRACNENEATPAGDNATGYIWVNPGGESTTPTYGNANIGAGDADGEGVDDGDDTNGTEGDDCP